MNLPFGESRKLLLPDVLKKLSIGVFSLVPSLQDPKTNNTQNNSKEVKLLFICKRYKITDIGQCESTKKNNILTNN